ncbi:embryonic polyadenylate-binding protein 2 isoform X1 [Pygocentrus nattereri]|uniref:embryonic polyadenylate-binding protein 2 isoform X1 n=2 Tax=Pygocentrus nattereri TaxID=42514 RepID=UPI0008148E81|nr:embryonic polyadenylate-binding protein 2 isoform X1 [Pygocentrus nattereri]
MAEQIYDIKGALNSGNQFLEDPELEAIKARVMEMEEEAEKLREVQYGGERQQLLYSPQAGLFYSMTHEERMDADNRSVYVGNVDYGTTADELEIHFNGCGHVNRVTILCDKFTGHPKGFAYIEFSDRESVRTAMALDETLFRGRLIKVLPKRTNMPGISTTDRGFLRGGRFRGRGFRGSRFNNGRFRGFIRSVLHSVQQRSYFIVV